MITDQPQRMRNPYLDFCIAVQAARRQAEGRRSPIAAACGVAASIYTHQISNTLRVLTDVRVRHLLADEVGLGKTVQALMILNALRRQRVNLRVLVVVPDRLVPQWRDEILTRAHSAPVGEGVGEKSQYIRLAWEDQLKSEQWSLSDIDPMRYDVLVVDELHKLTTEVQNRIVRTAKDFQHLLALTATPAFQDIHRHAQLFSLLEPERTAIAFRLGREMRGQSTEGSVDDASDLSDEDAATVVTTLVDRDRAAFEANANVDLTLAALTDCAYRRAIRTRRTDFRGVLPARRHLPQVVEPLYVESERQNLMWQYFDHLDDLSLKLDPVLLAKRVILSPPSLEQRVDFLRRRGHEREGLLEQVKPLVSRRAGDSRVDALVDLLNLIWIENPDERVLVAAQDNLTVDYLYEVVCARLGKVGPLNCRKDLIAARIRQGMNTDAVENLAAVGNETNENLEAFQRGDALVLFAPEAAQVGLNLQCARVLILYSVPWRPEEVEQWIGRLDRIGNVAAFSAEGHKTIDVYTIVQHGLVDEKVVRVLERFRVFEHSVNLDGRHLAHVTEAIEKAALHPDEANWQRFEADAERMAKEDAALGLDSPLHQHLPWTPAASKALMANLDTIPPFQPVLVDLPSSARKGLRAWDRAFEGMLKLLKTAGEYRSKTNSDCDGYKFKSLWYSYGEPGIQGVREVLSRVAFSFGPDPFLTRSPENAFCYITKRGQIDAPPRRTVELVVDDRAVHRPLRFLSFGDQLHDELIERWLPVLSEHAGGVIEIALLPTHPFFEEVPQSGAIAVRITELDPIEVLKPRDEVRRSMEAVTSEIRKSGRVSELILPFIARVRCALEADSRWLSHQLQTVFALRGVRKTPGGWEAVPSEALSALLNPLLTDNSALSTASALPFNAGSQQLVEEGFGILRDGDHLAAGLEWESVRAPFLKSVESRIEVLTRERNDDVAVCTFEVQEAAERSKAAAQKGNKAQVARADIEYGLAADRLAMAGAYWDRRLDWLGRCASDVFEVKPRELVAQIIRVQRIKAH